MLAALALADPPSRGAGDWLVVDAPGGVLLGVTVLVGLAAVLLSPAYGPGRHARDGGLSPWRTYYASLLAFWALLLAVPLCANLAGAWLLVEASTAATALLVGLSGKRRALEAGWKYLVLGTLGLGVALLGIVLLQTAQGSADDLGALGFARIAASAGGLDGDIATVALVLIVGGLAAKIGWAPVHNWLPDAHSEAPAPVSAMLSSAPCRPSCSSRGASPTRSRRPPARLARGSSWASASPRSRSRCRSSGGRSPGSACSRTRASSTSA